MDSWQYIGPYVFWIFLAVIIIAGMFFGYLKSRSRDSTIRDLAERGQTIPPEMFGPLGSGRGGKGGLLVGGLVMLFIGIGLIVMAWQMNGSPYQYTAEGMPLAVGAIPGGIGVALILSYIFLGRDKGGY